MQIAQRLVISAGPTPLEIIGPLDERFTDLASVINAALPYIYAIAGIILFVFIVWGGFDYLTAMGNPKKAEAGKNKITYALIGFFMIFAAFWISQIISYIFKLNIF